MGYDGYKATSSLMSATKAAASRHLIEALPEQE
jgi:hypothetical protein